MLSKRYQETNPPKSIPGAFLSHGRALTNTHRSVKPQTMLEMIGQPLYMQGNQDIETTTKTHYLHTAITIATNTTYHSLQNYCSQSPNSTSTDNMGTTQFTCEASNNPDVPPKDR